VTPSISKSSVQKVVQEMMVELLLPPLQKVQLKQLVVVILGVMIPLLLQLVQLIQEQDLKHVQQPVYSKNTVDGV